ncbi:pilus assembly PilX family protein [Wenzhouxiangella sp. EGI_FJ10409]|uniref:pilus assembly PilX family protein n=1 Tax=Wenzhouxiangella sp. EGI_FJ10409 TaxID=3243767 RepID=UPI0035D730B5
MKRSIEFRKQQGVALFVGLMFLLVLTLLGLSASNGSIMQERMAGNVADYNAAFQDAERTLREVESRITEFSQGGSGGLGAIPTWEDWDLPINDCSMSTPSNWESWAGDRWKTAPSTGNEYFILDLSDYVNDEGLPTASACRPVSESEMNTAGEYFVIVAKGSGPAGSEAIVQSIFFWPQ